MYPKMPPPQQPHLSEDEIDDILYYARTGALTDLTSLCNHVCTRECTSLLSLLSAAQDPLTHNTPLHMSAANGHSEILSYLLTAPPPSSTQSATPASLAPLVQPLLNARNAAGNTALHWAALNGHLECVKVLVAHGADVEVRNGAGRDVLGEAEWSERWEVLEWIVRRGGDGVEEGSEMDVGKGVEDGKDGMREGVRDGAQEMNEEEEDENGREEGIREGVRKMGFGNGMVEEEEKKV